MLRVELRAIDNLTAIRLRQIRREESNRRWRTRRGAQPSALAEDRELVHHDALQAEAFRTADGEERRRPHGKRGLRLIRHPHLDRRSSHRHLDGAVRLLRELDRTADLQHVRHAEAQSAREIQEAVRHRVERHRPRGAGPGDHEVHRRHTAVRVVHANLRRAAHVQAVQTDQCDRSGRFNRIQARAELQQRHTRITQHHADGVRIRVAIVQRHRALAEEDVQSLAHKSTRGTRHAVIRVVEAHVAFDGHEVRDVDLQVGDKEPKDVARLRLGLREENRDARAVHVDALVHRRARRVDAEARRRAHAHATLTHLELARDDARDSRARAVLLDHQRSLPVLNHPLVVLQSADLQVRHRDADDTLVARLASELLEEEVAVQRHAVRDRDRHIVGSDPKEGSGRNLHLDGLPARRERLVYRHGQIVNLNAKVSLRKQLHVEVVDLERILGNREPQRGRDSLRCD